jgi:hypothetical protein
MYLKIMEEVILLYMQTLSMHFQSTKLNYNYVLSSKKRVWIWLISVRYIGKIDTKRQESISLLKIFNGNSKYWQNEPKKLLGISNENLCVVYAGGCSSVVERPFRIRKASGSIPDISTLLPLHFFVLSLQCFRMLSVYIECHWSAIPYIQRLFYASRCL